MLDPLTIIFMGISVVSVGLNIPLLKYWKKCSCVNDGGEVHCNSNCKTVETKIKPKLKNVCKDYKEEDYEHETKAETKTA
jgi:hypothetical protein